MLCRNTGCNRVSEKKRYILLFTVIGLSIGSSNSLQILHQLEEKQRVLQWYVSFLKDLQLWEKVSFMAIVWGCL